MTAGANLAVNVVRVALIERFAVELRKRFMDKPIPDGVLDALNAAMIEVAGAELVAESVGSVGPFPWPPARNTWFTEANGKIHKSKTGDIARGDGACGIVVEDPSAWFHIDPFAGPAAYPCVFEGRHCPVCRAIAAHLAGAGPADARLVR